MKSPGVFIKARRVSAAVVINVLVTLLSVTCIFPIIWMVYSSLKSQQQFAVDTVGLPQQLHFSNYVQAITEGKLAGYFLNSMFNTLVTVAVVVFLTFITAYCLGRFRFRGRTGIYYLFLSGMLIPIYALLIPIFIEFKALGLLNNRLTLILPYIAFALPIAVFLIESYIQGIPIELEEAAHIDGCGTLRCMFAIIMPVCKPVLATVAILTFLNTWNEFPLALVLVRSNSLKTMPIGLTNFVGAYTVDYPLMMAALVISALPVILMYLLFYNQVMKGMVAGAVKG